MPSNIKPVRAGDPITAKWANAIIARLTRLEHLRTDGTIRMSENSAGITLSAAIPPQPFYFQLTQDTPAIQGYVTCRPLRWIQANNKYQTVSTEPELKIYDRINNLTYGSTAYRGPSNWTKKNFVGKAIWAADKGQWEIWEIEHVARKINFTLNAAIALGGSQVDGTVTDRWDGLDPTTAISGAVNLLCAPINKWAANSGAKGSATWRPDLDNSTKWQYQIDDLDILC